LSHGFVLPEKESNRDATVLEVPIRKNKRSFFAQVAPDLQVRDSEIVCWQALTNSIIMMGLREILGISTSVFKTLHLLAKKTTSMVRFYVLVASEYGGEHAMTGKWNSSSRTKSMIGLGTVVFAHVCEHRIDECRGHFHVHGLDAKLVDKERDVKVSCRDVTSDASR